MRLSPDITGAREKAQALRQFKEELPRETEVGLMAGMQPITGALRTYPPQPPYMGRPTTGPVRMYVRTGDYARGISTPAITREGDTWVGTIKSTDPASRWLRGTPEGDYRGAWMHTPFWESLKDLLDRLLPRVREQVDGQIGRLQQRLGLGD